MIVLAYIILTITIISTIAAFTGAFILRERNNKRLKKTQAKKIRK